MTCRPTTRLRDRLRQSVAPFLSFFQGPFVELNEDPDVANFAVGNPQEMPLPAYVEALQRHVVPRNKDWFAYKLSEPASQRTVAATLTQRTGLDWDPADVAMTNGGFAAIATALRTLVDPGDEVVFLSPPWFFYEQLILAAGGEPVRVTLDPPRWDLDVDRIAAGHRSTDARGAGELAAQPRAAASTAPMTCAGWPMPWRPPRTASAIRSGSSPTSRTTASCSMGASTPARRSSTRTPIITYSYGKTLLAPGQRIGYLTVPPTLPERAEIRDEIFIQQLAGGFAFPNALLQHALADLETLSIDIGALERRRDRLVPALRDLGYETTMPEGTFYAMARSPIDDDVAFADILARHQVLVLPGSIVEVPGWFRISLTASDQMVEDGIPRFEAARARRWLGRADGRGAATLASPGGGIRHAAGVYVLRPGGMPGRRAVSDLAA